VTGACLAIRADTFAALGGFDEGFVNGYEDVDLCLACLGAGLRVVYEPASTITHHESQSGPERFARASDNIARLRNKWSAAA
jgi:GT2 family glycosyltransferase